MPLAREFSQHVHLANTPEVSPQAVRDALSDTSLARQQARRQVAAQHTWEARVEQLSDLIRVQLTAKGHQGLPETSKRWALAAAEARRSNMKQRVIDYD